MSFMDADSAGLVKYDLVPVHDPRGTYRLEGSRWAEPDAGHAAALLRQLADDPSARAALAARGRETAMRALGDAPVRDALAASGIR